MRGVSAAGGTNADGNHSGSLPRSAPISMSSRHDHRWNARRPHLRRCAYRESLRSPGNPLRCFERSRIRSGSSRTSPSWMCRGAGRRRDQFGRAWRVGGKLEGNDQSPDRESDRLPGRWIFPNETPATSIMSSGKCRCAATPLTLTASQWLRPPRNSISTNSRFVKKNFNHVDRLWRPRGA